MSTEDTIDVGLLGPRQRVLVGDGTWWELGWDATVETYYAEHYRVGERGQSQLLAWVGSTPGEFSTAAALAEHLPVAVPPEKLEELDKTRLRLDGPDPTAGFGDRTPGLDARPTEVAEGERPLGARYRVDQPNGTWWELGWDRPLGTFYAQHHSPIPYDPFTEPELLAWHGTELGELPTVESLAAVLPVAIPPSVVDELHADAEAYPHTGPPPFYFHAGELVVAPDGASNGEIRAVRADNGLDRLPDDARLEAEMGQARAPLPATLDGTPPSLPAAPLARALRDLHADHYTGGEDLGTFARGLGLDAGLVSGVLAGEMAALDVEQVAGVCEALRCSPYDLWGPELGRSLLPVYGPERWPRYIEPLGDGRDVPGAEEFVRRRVDMQATEILSPSARPPSEADTTLAPVYRLDGDRTLTLEATCYQRTAVMAIDAAGERAVVEDLTTPATPDAAYHFCFAQLAPPQPVRVALAHEQFAAGCPAGQDADPILARAADRLDRSEPGIDLVRFADPAHGTEQWLGRETPFDRWETWDDPRHYYPGPPTDVLDPGPFVDDLSTTDRSPVVDLTDEDLATGEAGTSVEALSIEF